MRNNRPSRRSRRNTFSRLFGSGTPKARKAPRRRDLERLEERQMLTASPQTNEFFANQWYLFANGQNTEFDPTSPTVDQTLAVVGEDINVLSAWAQGVTGAGIQVAIIDGGFDLGHEDLVFAYVDLSTLSTNADLLDGDGLPAIVDTTDFLGTALAGLIAAADNDLGIVGIAHGAEIFPVRLSPGANDANTPTIDAINAAFRFQAGFVQDGDGDGIPDALLGGSFVPVDIDGDGIVDGLGQDPSLVTDVFVHTGNYQDSLEADNPRQSPRVALALPDLPSTINGQNISILEAITDTAINGRSIWVDSNNDGLLGTDEIISLGAIHIVPAGNDAGSNGTTPPFIVPGDLASSQYDALANSIYTIAVGAVDYDGSYENSATGDVSGYSEGGANVLIVAPSGNLSQDISTQTGLNSGLVSTDLTGSSGANAPPVFNFEFDGDYFADIDYTSTLSGTEAAAAQVGAVVALMLEANPRLSARDVQQILMQSARQNDQFSETWITNAMQGFVDPEVPLYRTYTIDTDRSDGLGDDDIVGILPNSQYDPILQDFLLERGFFFNENASVDLGVPFVYAPGTAMDLDENPIFFDDVGGNRQIDEFGYQIPRFADVLDPTILLGKATIGADGVAVDADEFDTLALPIIERGSRNAFIPNPDPDGDPIPFVQEYISLMYQPNGNVTRGLVQSINEDLLLEFVDEAMTIPLLVPAPVSTSVGSLVAAPDNVSVSGFGPNDPVIIFAEGTVGENQRAGLGGLITPLTSGTTNSTPLEFENGAGFTVSSGYGSYLEDISYGHGVLDAGLAVELAIAWDTYNLYLGESITLSSGVIGGTVDITLQPAINITTENGVVVQTVTGGIDEGQGGLNATFYNEFFRTIEVATISDGDNDVGEVITGAPFFNLDDPIVSNRLTTEIPFTFDASLTEDFLSIEWLELTGSIASGDVDNLRISIRSPDGTQSELNAYRPEAGPVFAPQLPQGQQGSQTPFLEPIDSFVGGISLDSDGQFINDSKSQQIGSVGSSDALAANQSWTWTTNRHWGELFSTLGNSPDIDNFGEGWTIILENHGVGTGVSLGGNFEVTVHGTAATGNRIQGKVGIDDNKQGITETDQDENFNFDRHIEFGILDLVVENATGKVVTTQQMIILDDLNDSVTYTNANDPDEGLFSLDNIYKTVDPDTGEEFYYPVVNRDDYTQVRGSEDAGINLLTTVEEFFQRTLGDETYQITRAELGTSVDRFLDPQDDLTVDAAVANGFYGTLPFDFRGDPLVFRNFDYSQEGFASGVTVSSTQMETTYDLTASLAAGVATPAAAGTTATGVVDYFTTGADGNYYFDVEATPAPPTIEDCLALLPIDPDLGPTPEQIASAEAHFRVAFGQWFQEFGGSTFTYEISVLGNDASRIITNGGEGYFDTPNVFSTESQVAYDGASSYTVSIFADDGIRFGETTTLENINFLLEVDPALTNVPVQGSVYRDRNGNGVQDAGIDESVEGAVVYYDANVNGVLDAGETSVTTGADGTYSFVISGLLSPADARIGITPESIPVDLVTANPVSGLQTINATPGIASTADFTLRLSAGEPAIVVGSVFEDLNGNGVRDTGEDAFSDTVLINGMPTAVKAYVDLDGDAVRDEGEPSADVRTDGTFLIESSITGPAEVRIELPSGQLSQTTPIGGGGVAVTLTAGQQVTLTEEFGIFDGRVFDYGDLYVDPAIGANFPTLLSDDGARHVVVSGIRLGASVDIDSDGFQNLTRNPGLDGFGDDYDNLDDEDGVVLASGEFLPNDSLQFAIEAYGQGAVLNAWIDFNGNGKWESHEQVFTNLSDIAFGPNGEDPTASVPVITVPGVQQAGQGADDAFLDVAADGYAARFRWGPFGLGVDGAANAGEVEDYIFAATPPIVITGAVRDDTADGNGVFDPTDVGVEGVRVFYDIDVDGIVDFDEPRAFTDANGEYRLEINADMALDVTIRIDTSTLPIGIETLMPNDGIFNQNVGVSGTVQSNYLVGAPQGLMGSVFSDADNDAIRDGGEGGFAGIVVEVYQDADSNGSFETLVNSMTTDANGNYTVPIESAGLYSVRLNLTGRQFLTQTLPTVSGARTVTVAGGAFTNVLDFGVFDAVPTFTLDYGDLIVDATRNFPTTLADDGARHTRVSGVFLGAVEPDADPGSLQSAAATADDNLFSPDDEDGVRMRSNIATDSTVRIDVTATGASTNRLHAWIDFNNDGDWDDAGERITSAGGNTLASGLTSQLVIDTTGIEVDATATAYAARFRWGQGITGYTGLATSGEVEDYLLARVNSTNPTGTTLESDFNGDGTVDLLDLDALGANFGAGPGATAAQGDANGDGNVDLLDLDILGSEFGSVASSSMALALASGSEEEASEPQIALATASQDPEGVPPLMLMPIDNVYEPIVLDANAFAPMLLASSVVTSAVDESLAVEADTVEGGDAIDAALLEWSLEGAVGEDEEANVFSAAGEEADADEADSSDELFASVFAF